MITKPLEIKIGIPETVQESSFANATLQGPGSVAFSIATYVEITTEVAAKGQRAVAAFLREKLTPIATNGVTFVVQIGKANS